MADITKLKKIADIMIHYSVELKKGEKILLIGYGFEAYPLIKELYREAVKAGAIKIDVRFPQSELSRIFYEEADEKQLKYLDPLEKKTADNYDAMIQIVADENPFEMSQIDHKKIVMAQKARKPVSDILHEKKWCLFYYPSRSYAQTAKKPMEEWENFVLDATIKDWKKEQQMQRKFIKLMEKVKHIRITGEETDLELSIDGQKWKECCGKRNLPDGEIFTSPVKNSVNGVIKYNMPTRYLSHDFDWVKLTLKNGKVVKEESNNQKALTEILNTDQGSRYYGEFAFGLNNEIKEASRIILYDEKMGKSLHMALGKCYEECPNGNDSNVHWDLVFHFKTAKAELYFDGKKVFEKNKWTDKQFDFLNK